MSNSWIYMAGPLFTKAEVNFNQNLADTLTENGYRIYLPQQECAGVKAPEEQFAICIRGIDKARIILAILDGTDADSGTCFEMGYAHAKNIPIVGLRTDFRGSGEHLGINLMLSNSCAHLLLTALNPPPSSDRVTYLQPGEDFIPPLLQVLRRYAA
ncbi:nucleoside 2-deoxyribosyltransferase [Phormidium sp. CCY1219]|uniref:nucleoside 2-deoxyribosyltransferase n=1 Tax=Phormidium sp. CCY1219 TaxID=2886104 RepID=UPI002D1EFAB2|nr:nucleoside 2-deoxyribosyltransferase [Phormidium sp. CCY1219]MEB3830907.1 nucleoside 2-deoxyribosyltransferase [Phormidium sp. CCY1219]